MNQESSFSRGLKNGLASRLLHPGINFGAMMVIQQKILTICGMHGKRLAQLSRLSCQQKMISPAMTTPFLTWLIGMMEETLVFRSAQKPSAQLESK